jgi:hypothetical protein
MVSTSPKPLLASSLIRHSTTTAPRLNRAIVPGSGGKTRILPLPRPPPDGSRQTLTVKKYEQFSEALEKFRAAAEKWTADARTCLRQWYADDLKTVMKDARKSADLALKVDISAIQGRGPEFILEFTAIIVIIFAAVILGVATVLDSQQIGTLLAAIAGYVLGKGVARVQTQSTSGSDANAKPPTDRAAGPALTPPEAPEA